MCPWHPSLLTSEQDQCLAMNLRKSIPVQEKQLNISSQQNVTSEQRRIPTGEFLPQHILFQLESKRVNSTNVRGGKKKGQSMCSNRYSFLHFYNFMSRKTDRVNKPEKNQTSITELCLYRAFILSWSLFYLLICPHSTYTQQVSLLIEPLIHLFIYLFTWKILIKQLPCLKKNTLLNTVKGHRHN